MRMTALEYAAYLHRQQNSEELVQSSEPAVREIGKEGLQAAIMEWCDLQFPKWVYDFPRTDLKSTLPNGRHDATIWGPFPKCFLIETKAKGKKRSMDQQIWETRLRVLGWQVHLVYSLEEFRQIAEGDKPQQLQVTSASESSGPDEGDDDPTNIAD